MNFLSAIPMWAKALALLAIVGAIFYAGGSGPRAELKAFKAEVTAAAEKQKAENARKDAEQTAKFAQQEKDHAEENRVRDASWNSELMRLTRARSGGATKPVPIAAGICNDAARDARLSDAIQRAQREVGDAIAEYRAGVAGLIERGEQQSRDYAKAVEAVNTARAIAEGRP